MENKFIMSLSLNVLNHLGINLYSNIPAVLSEIVANSWDADAKRVDITIAEDQIIIEDDGCGMSADDINNKFLYVGYTKKRRIVRIQKYIIENIWEEKALESYQCFQLHEKLK